VILLFVFVFLCFCVFVFLVIFRGQVKWRGGVWAENEDENRDFSGRMTF